MTTNTGTGPEATDAINDLKAIADEFGVAFQLTDPGAAVTVEQRTINNLFFALVEARHALAALGAGEPPVEEIDWDRFTVVYLGTSWKAPEGEFLAVVRDREQGRPLIGKDFEGIGPTIDAAIRNAVAAAKGEQ